VRWRGGGGGGVAETQRVLLRSTLRQRARPITGLLGLLTWPSRSSEALFPPLILHLCVGRESRWERGCCKSQGQAPQLCASGTSRHLTCFQSSVNARSDWCGRCCCCRCYGRGLLRASPLLLLPPERRYACVGHGAVSEVVITRSRVSEELCASPLQRLAAFSTPSPPPARAARRLRPYSAHSAQLPGKPS
jgi:hypothetical protein